jgi:hypothetical protein
MADLYVQRALNDLFEQEMLEHRAVKSLSMAILVHLWHYPPLFFGIVGLLGPMYRNRPLQGPLHPDP